MDFLTAHQEQFVETAVCVFAFLLLRLFGHRIVRNAIVRSSFKAKEEKEILRLLNLFNAVVFAIVITAIWGVKQSEILIFATSVITVLGVAFFAEMSILSNITSCLVLFFQHPIKIGDTLKVYDEDDVIEGELIDITYFFVFIRTVDRGTVTIPNSVLLKCPFYVTESTDIRKQ
ncbi:MAG: mechanosensitive ion channel [Flavobacteriales bacterium]|nr:mechanosensitive ion channel [Flavobacteriales bacterium]